MQSLIALEEREKAIDTVGRASCHEWKIVVVVAAMQKNIMIHPF